MYCVKCGVELDDAEKVCPLCGLKVYHPDLKLEEAKKSYPISKVPSYETVNKQGILLLITAALMVPVVICILCDIAITGSFSWSGYVLGGILLFYVCGVLPAWFKNPNPVIFVPCSFACAALYLLYINFATGGRWFLSFALPVVGGICIIISAVVTLMYYLHRGRLYILGGAFMALGAFMLLIEFLMCMTFGLGFIGWSVYPLVVLVLFGGLLIYLAIDSVAREMMDRKLFF